MPRISFPLSAPPGAGAALTDGYGGADNDGERVRELASAVVAELRASVHIPGAIGGARAQLAHISGAIRRRHGRGRLVGATAFHHGSRWRRRRIIDSASTTDAKCE